MIYKMTLTDSADSMTMDLLEVPIADTDVEGAVDNTTIDGNVFTDYLWLKKKYVQKWSIMCSDEYDRLRGFYTRQWTNASPAQYRLFYGENIFTDYSESGDYIVVNNSSDISAPVTNFAMYGDATQQTYTGKNLFDISKVITNGTDVVNNGDGTLTISGYGKGGTAPNKLKDYCPTLQEGDTVILSATTTSTNKFIYLAQGSNVSWYFGASRTITATDLNSIVLWYAYSGNTNPATISDIQIELGSATSYEPYVGGIPAPNPDYPQEIHTVTGENTLKIVGKNLFDIKTLATGGVSVDDGVAVGQASAFHTNTGSGLVLPFTPTGQLTITATAWTNGNQSTAGTGGLLFRIIYTDGSTAYPQDGTFYNSSTTPTTLSFTTNSTKDVEKICLSYGNAGGNIWHITNIQIEEGTTATEFEDFSEQDAPITLASKNLFDVTNVYDSPSGANLDYTTNDDMLTLTAVTSTGAQYVRYIFTGFDKTKKYTYSFKSKKVVKGTDGQSRMLVIVYGSDTPTNASSWTQLSAKGQTTPTEGTEYFDYATVTGYKAYRFFVYNNSSTPVTVGEKTEYWDFMMEEGESVTSYVPYLNIELAEIGTSQDLISFDGAKWWLHKEVGKVVLNGTENGWGYNSTYGVFWGNYANLLKNGFPSNQTGYFPKISDNFTYYAMSGNVAQRDDGLYENSSPSGASQILFHYSAIASLADWKTWLASNPTTIYFPLLNPTDTEITDSTLLSQLNAIYELYVKSGKNSILIMPTSPNPQPDFDIGYRVFSEQETDIVSIVPVRLGLTDDGVINTCGCRRNIQLTMRETIQ